MGIYLFIYEPVEVNVLLIKVNLTKLYTNLILHKSKQVHFSPAKVPLNCRIKEYETSIWSLKYGI